MNKILLCYCVVVRISIIVAQAPLGPIVHKAKYVRTPPVTCDDIKFIVNFHNNGRRALANGTLEDQPKAGDMQKIAWDPRLAEIATNWTNQMIFGHNPGRRDSRFSIGENLFMTASTNTKNAAVEWRKPLRAWFNEYMYYIYEPAFDDPVTGHYTQMIWADTIYVGCSTTHFTDSKNWLYKYYVCNYGPAGNWYGDFPYTEDSGESEFEIMKAAGLLEGLDFQEVNCNDLCCYHNQCDKLYGPKCS